MERLEAVQKEIRSLQHDMAAGASPTAYEILAVMAELAQCVELNADQIHDIGKNRLPDLEYHAGHLRPPGTVVDHRGVTTVVNPKGGK